MKYQYYDLRGLDKHTRSLIVQNEIDAMLKDEVCSICGKPFIGREEKGNAYCSGINPLTYVHGYCWEKANNQ